jgi:excisionase family DNA binding protein
VPPGAAATKRAPAPSLPRMLSLAEVAELIDLSISTLRRQIRLKKLAVHRFGLALRVSEDDLADYLRRHRRAAR